MRQIFSRVPSGSLCTRNFSIAASRSAFRFRFVQAIHPWAASCPDNVAESRISQLLPISILYRVQLPQRAWFLSLLTKEVDTRPAQSNLPQPSPQKTPAQEHVDLTRQGRAILRYQEAFCLLYYFCSSRQNPPHRTLSLSPPSIECERQSMTILYLTVRQPKRSDHR